MEMRAARMSKELKILTKKPPWGITCTQTSESLDRIEVSLFGPRESPYEDGIFKLLIVLSDRYPFEPPQINFLTPVYHPNIDKGGRICMDMLKMPPKGTWLPTITLDTLLVSIQTLLATPNPDDPLMIDIAHEFKQDIDMFNMNAKKYTQLHAK